MRSCENKSPNISLASAGGEGDFRIETAKIMAEHWHNRHEVTVEYWKERNRVFLYTLVAVTVGLLLSVNINGTDTVINDISVYFTSITGSSPDNINNYGISPALVRTIVPLPLFYIDCLSIFCF